MNNKRLAEIKEELGKQTKKQLETLAKEYCVSDAHNTRKADLIDILAPMALDIEEAQEAARKEEEAKKAAVAETYAELEADLEEWNPDDEEAPQTVAEPKQVDAVEYDVAKRVEYVKRAALGTLVAFVVPNRTKVKSAKLIDKDNATCTATVETSYGQQYRINYDAVIWVKTGKRWARGVYEMLKKGEIDASYFKKG